MINKIYKVFINDDYNIMVFNGNKGTEYIYLIMKGENIK